MNCDKELLVGYLYDELTPAERVTFDAHVGRCDACRAEVQELRATRAQLATWAPPEPDFGFHIVRGAAAAPARWWRPMPAWGLAAAAVLVLAASAAMANLEVRYDQQGFAVTTGWSKRPVQPGTLVPTSTNVQHLPSDQMVQIKAADLKAITDRLGVLEQSSARGPAPSSSLSDVELLRRVRAIVDDSVLASEKRQRGELALRLAQLIRDVDASRESDLMRVQRALQQTQGTLDADLLRQSRQVDYLMRVSSQQK